MKQRLSRGHSQLCPFQVSCDFGGVRMYLAWDVLFVRKYTCCSGPVKIAGVGLPQKQSLLREYNDIRIGPSSGMERANGCAQSSASRTKS